MLILRFIILVIAFFVTLLWFTKLVTDSVSAMFGQNLSDDTAKADALARLYLIIAMSILWPLVIILS